MMQVSSLKLETLTLKVAPGKHFSAPAWAVPRGTNCTNGVAVHVIKEGEVLDTLSLDDGRLYTLFGRFPTCTDEDGVAIRLDHPSISRVHAAIVCGEHFTMYVIDLGSSHGTFVSGKRCQPLQAVPLQDRSVLTFGQSTRRYIVRVFPKNMSECICDEEMNTMMNCQVEYKKPSPLSTRAVVNLETMPKMERRVSFSCTAPEIIPMESSAIPIQAEGSSTPLEVINGSPDLTWSRKILLTSPHVDARESVPIHPEGDEEEDEVRSSLDSLIQASSTLPLLQASTRSSPPARSASRRTFAQREALCLRFEPQTSQKRVRPEATFKREDNIPASASRSS